MPPGAVERLTFREEMAFIHRAYRREFAKLPALVCAVEPTETGRRVAVASWLDDTFELLRHHHSNEDEILWPRLRNRLRDNADALTMLDEIAAEHDAIHKAADDAAVALDQWRSAGDETSRDLLATAIFAMNAVVETHFDREEADLCPLAEGYLTHEEWRLLHARDRKRTSGKAGRALIGALLSHANEKERKRYTASVRAPVRWFVIPAAKRSYARRMRSLVESR